MSERTHSRAVAHLALALLVLVGCQSQERGRAAQAPEASAASQQHGTQSTDPCGDRTARPTCPDPAERAVLAALPHWTRPAPTELVFRPGGGREVRFVDDTTEGDQYMRHRVVGRLPGTRYTVVERVGWEEHAYVLVGEAGDTTALAAWPVVSSDGARVALGSVDFVACFRANMLEVWRLDAGRPRREFAQQTGDCAEGTGWGPSDVAWRDERTIEFTVNRPVPNAVEPYAESPGRLTRSASGWTLAILPP